jgi:hypothetical protein
MPHPFALQVPADERYQVLAPEIAGKYAELVGGTVADGQSLGADVVEAMRRISARAPVGAAIDLAFSTHGGRVEITLKCAGETTVVRFALPARSQG